MLETHISLPRPRLRIRQQSHERYQPCHTHACFHNCMHRLGCAISRYTVQGRIGYVPRESTHLFQHACTPGYIDWIWQPHDVPDAKLGCSVIAATALRAAYIQACPCLAPSMPRPDPARPHGLGITRLASPCPSAMQSLSPRPQSALACGHSATLFVAGVSHCAHAPIHAYLYLPAA